MEIVKKKIGLQEGAQGNDLNFSLTTIGLSMLIYVTLHEIKIFD